MKKAQKSYRALKITIPSRLEDGVSSFLSDTGVLGLEIRENHTKSQLLAYFPASRFRTVSAKTRRYLSSLSKLFPGDFSYKLQQVAVPSLDWSSNWRKSFKPVVLQNKIAIVPAWHKGKTSAPVAVKIYPEMAFGTGTHPTTQSCLLALYDLVKPGHKVLDLGTGSGILAITAAKLGAGKVVAVDNDKEVKPNALKNIRLNHVQDKVAFKIGKLAALSHPQSFDLAIANLTGEEIFSEIEALRKLLKRSGFLIVSGWVKEDRMRLLSFLRHKKFAITKTNIRQGWVTVICKKR